MTTYYVQHDTKTNSINILSYAPNVPAGIAVYQITENEKYAIDTGTHYFDVKTASTQLRPAGELLAEQQARATQQANATYKNFLNSTDWKVFRHMRELALGKTTSLTAQEYIDLENERARAASKIK